MDMMPPNEHLDAPLPGPDWKAQQEAIRSRILSLLGPFPTTPPPVEAEVVERSDGTGRTYTREKVRIRSEADDWITAYVLIPQGLQRAAPALVCPHPTTEGAGKDEVVGISGSKPGTPIEPKYCYGLEPAAEWGFVTVAPDGFHDGERAGPGKVNDTSAFYERHPEWSALGKMIWDTRRVVDYLQTRPEVNPDAIGIIGHSMGAHVALFTAAFDERIGACVANGGTLCWDEGERMHWGFSRYDDGRTFEYIRRARPLLEAAILAMPFSLVEVGALVAPRPQMVLLTENGARRQRLPDFIMQVRRTYKALCASEALESGMYAGGHRFPPEFRLKAYQWLKFWLTRGERGLHR